MYLSLLSAHSWWKIIMKGPAKVLLMKLKSVITILSIETIRMTFQHMGVQDKFQRCGRISVFAYF